MKPKAVKAPLQPPDHLSTTTAAWWLQVVDSYELQPHHLLLLTLCATALDRCNAAREQLERDGPTIAGRQGTKVHPLVKVEIDSRASFAMLLRHLGLDEIGEPHRAPGRPPAGSGITVEGLAGLPEWRPPRPGRRPKRRRADGE